MREDLSHLIGRGFLSRSKETEELYRLEAEVCECLARAAHELTRFFSDAVPESDRVRLSIGEEVFTLLDSFRPDSIPAAVAFLARYGYMVEKQS
jgi:hypothetical protein